MDFRTLWLQTSVDSRHGMVVRLGSSYKYLQKLAGGFGTPSGKLALKMVKHYPELELALLLNPPAKERVKPGPAPKPKAPAKRAATKRRSTKSR